MTDRPDRLRRVGAGLVAAAVLALASAVAPPASAARDDDLLTTGEQLVAGDRLVSPSGRYALELVGTELRLTERASRFTSGGSDVLRRGSARMGPHGHPCAGRTPDRSPAYRLTPVSGLPRYIRPPGPVLPSPGASRILRVRGHD